MSTIDDGARGFSSWFREATGAELPVALDEPLVHLRGQAWASPSIASRTAPPLSLPMTAAFDEPEGDYCIAGHWGHGVNSWAIYLVRRRGEHRCFFRLSYGGAYGDRERDAERVVAFLSGYQRFAERWGSRLRRSHLLHEMGLGSARVVLEDGTEVGLDDPPDADVEGFWRRLEDRLSEAGAA